MADINTEDYGAVTCAEMLSIPSVSLIPGCYRNRMMAASHSEAVSDRPGDRSSVNHYYVYDYTWPEIIYSGNHCDGDTAHYHTRSDVLVPYLLSSFHLIIKH